MYAVDNNLNQEFFVPRPIKSRYITVREDVHLTLTSNALKIYMALRFDADYSQDVSSVRRNVKYISDKTRISIRECYYCFNELEAKGLLKRDATPGSQTVYWVAEDLFSFCANADDPPQNCPDFHKNPEPKTPKIDQNRPKVIHRKIDQIGLKVSPNDQGSQELCQNEGGGLQNMQGGLQNMHTIISNTSNIREKDLNPIVDLEKSPGEFEGSFLPEADHNPRSDYLENQSYSGKGHPLAESTIEPEARSDYQKNQIKLSTVFVKKDQTEKKEYKEDAEFMDWYSRYPNKKKPSVAWKAWKKLKPTPEFVKMLIEDVESRKTHDWLGRQQSFIPHPSTYLSGRYWEGELTKPEITPAKPVRDIRKAMIGTQYEKYIRDY